MHITGSAITQDKEIGCLGEVLNRAECTDNVNQLTLIPWRSTHPQKTPRPLVNLQSRLLKPYSINEV